VDAIDQTNPETKSSLRWTYIILPVSFLLVSLILTAFFYRLLPAEITYRLQGDIPEKWMGRGALVLWMNLPQVVFFLLSLATVRLVLTGAHYWSADETPLNQLLPLMGNMVALPQLILLVVMLNLFLYNAYHVQMMPVWIIVVVIMAAGCIVLGIIFIRIIRRYRRRQTKN
jgi:Na+/melibiose symporter-like transporter